MASLRSEVQRLKRKVNRLNERNKKNVTKIDELKAELEAELVNQPDIDIDIISEAITLLRTEHDQVHHAGTCNSCRALAMLEREFDVSHYPWNPDGFRKLNAIQR